MKFEGFDFTVQPEEAVSFRGGAVTMVVQAVKSYDEFNQLCPDPTPPVRTLPNGTQEIMLEDPTYLEKVEEKNEKRLAWLVIKGLESNTELVWDEVKLSKPSTWLKWKGEMEAAGLTGPEINRIIQKVVAVNSISGSKIEEAEKAFLASRRAK